MSSAIAKVLREAGQSVTRSRLLVFGALEAAREPVSMGYLVADLAGRVDRASVYRAIALFRELGIIRDLGLGSSAKLELGDRFDPHHHHLTCDNCGRSISFKDAALEGQLEMMAARHGFELADHQLELTGRCADCRAK